MHLARPPPQDVIWWYLHVLNQFIRLIDDPGTAQEVNNATVVLHFWFNVIVSHH